MNKLIYYYTRETVKKLTVNKTASMEVCCSFKSIVGGPCSFTRRESNRTRSREIVPLSGPVSYRDFRETGPRAYKPRQFQVIPG